MFQFVGVKEALESGFGEAFWVAAIWFAAFWFSTFTCALSPAAFFGHVAGGALQKNLLRKTTLMCFK